MAISIEIQKNAEGIIAVMKGSLDTLAAEQMEDKVKEIEAAAATAAQITLDCTELSYIASAGLRLLLRIKKAASSKDTKVTLLNVNDNIMEVLAITHFDKMFVIAN